MRKKSGKIALYNSANKINETKKAIIDIIKDWDNNVFVFDFGHYYYDETINKKTDVYPHFLFKTVISGSQRYIDTLFPKGKDKNTTYKHFDRNIKEICNISNIVTEDDVEKEGGFELKIKEIVSKGIFDTSDWAGGLAKKKIGGCLLVSSIVEGNHHSAVWVVLEKPIRGLDQTNGKVYCCMPSPCEKCVKKEDCAKVPLKDDVINSIFSRIDDLLMNELVYNSEQRTNFEITRQSTRAAITQVYERNLANHLVPNVLIHMTDEKAYSVEKISQLICAKTYKAETYKKELSKINPNRQVANLFSYLVNRSRYINKAIDGVATKVERRFVYNRLFNDLDANRILLNFISGESNFKYEIDFKHNGESLNDKNDILVSLPDGDLGAQAFYIILENIIRNTAKHNNRKTDVKFSVNFFDDGPLDKENSFFDEGKYYRVEIWDNAPITMNEADFKKKKKSIKKEEQYNNYFQKKSGDFIENAADLLVYKLNTQMNNSVFDPHRHTLRTSSLGLIEMEASAAFLRQIDLPEIESENYTLKHGQHFNRIEDKDYPYFMQAFKKKLNDNNDFSLGYRFYMKKTKLITSKNNNRR